MKRLRKPGEHQESTSFSTTSNDGHVEVESTLYHSLGVECVQEDDSMKASYSTDSSLNLYDQYKCVADSASSSFTTPSKKLTTSTSKSGLEPTTICSKCYSRKNKENRTFTTFSENPRHSKDSELTHHDYRNHREIYENTKNHRQDQDGYTDAEYDESDSSQYEDYEENKQEDYEDDDKTTYLNISMWNVVKFPNHMRFIRLLTCLLMVCYTLNYGCAQQISNPFLADDETPNTTYISQVLNRLVDKSKYDKRLRPTYGGGPVMVGITLHVSSISAVSEVDMDFTIDFYLRQTWQDPRLAFGKLDLGFQKIKSLTVGVEYLDRLWKPDTFFPNEKKSFFHTSTSHNSFLRIDPDGRVLLSQRLTVTATCPMKLKLFPMDTQECKLEIESYGYTTADIELHWGKIKGEEPAIKAVAFDSFGLPQFHRTGYRVNVTEAVTSSGRYVRLYVQMILTRNLGFYLMNIIIPSMLIVSISWVSFWLNREASPARVGLGVTTVLTMTTLITTTNNSMPKVSYVKGLDVFLNFCFIMVFASLVEYAVVSYWNKRQSRRRQQRKARAQNNEPTEMPMFTNYPTTPAGGLAVSPNQSYVYRPPGLPSVPPDCDCRAIPLVQYAQMTNDNTFHQTIPFPKMRRKRPLKCQVQCSPAKIDRCSRAIFPFTFIMFNVLYWTVLRKLAENDIVRDFQEFKNNVDL